MRKPNRADYVYVTGFATRCYEVALEKGYSEEYARHLFLAGQTMMVGYYFHSDYKSYNKICSGACLDLFGCEMKLSEQDKEIIDTAILTTYPVTGYPCNVYNFLSNLKSRFGEDSEEYTWVLNRGKELDLISEDFGKEQKTVEVNSNGVNKKIKAHILDDKTMEEIGFTEYRKGFLYFCRIVDRDLDISFSVTIPRDGSDISIDVLDEAFCQPYDYQNILVNNPEHKTALRVQSKVEEWMKYLQDKGVLSGHIPGEYI